MAKRRFKDALRERRRSARAERIRRASRAASARYYAKLDAYNRKRSPTANDIALLKREWQKSQKLRALEKTTWAGGANAPLVRRN